MITAKECKALYDAKIIADIAEFERKVELEAEAISEKVRASAEKGCNGIKVEIINDQEEITQKLRFAGFCVTWQGSSIFYVGF